MDARIVEVGRNAWRTVEAEDSGVLIDAADYYRAFFESAARASRLILVSGWQFDSGVALLRGDAVPGSAEVRLLPFLNGLCELKPELEVLILAWDFHLVFAAEREWMQRVYFGWMTNVRFRFLFDDCPVAGGSHHQKFAVFDGTHAFVGGMDVCEGRWDDRRHLADNPLRTTRGEPHKPYHDVQAWVAGRTASAALVDLFAERWRNAGGIWPEPALPYDDAPPRRPRGLLPFGPAPIAISRTDPRPDGASVREIESLLVDAIAAAERLVYLETQYFSSRRVRDALAARMRDRGRATLEIVILVNERAEALKEEIAVGLRQAENVAFLRDVARRTGHALGVYEARCDGESERFRRTYIHSKVALVDDRFLTVGSANLTNRSMGTDSELQVSWEALGDGRGARRTARAVRRVRVSLLAEHGGLTGLADVRALVPPSGLVGRLERIARRPGARLVPNEGPSAAQEAALQVIDPEELPFDPENAPPDAGDDEPSDEPRPGGGGLAEVVASLWELVAASGRPLARRYVRR